MYNKYHHHQHQVQVHLCMVHSETLRC
jgi:hypothetical protein